MNHIYVTPVPVHAFYGITMWVLEVRAPSAAVWHQGEVKRADWPFTISYLDENGDTINRTFAYPWDSENEAIQFALAKRTELLAKINAGERIDHNVSILAHPAVIIE